MEKTSIKHVYKILSASDWGTAERLGHTQTELDEGDGYVHLSTRSQVADTLRLHYAGQDDIRLLEFELEALADQIRWEESRGGQSFPHLYGRLNIAAATRMWLLRTAPDRSVQLPEDIDQ